MPPVGPMWTPGTDTCAVPEAKPSVTLPEMTRASWPASSYDSYTNSFSDGVPDGMSKAPPPNSTVADDPEPEKAPGDAVAVGLTVRNRSADPGTSTRIRNSLR